VHRYRLSSAAALLLLTTACSGSPLSTQEELALRTCSAELGKRLDVPDGELTSQTQMIGQREYGWLVRGLSSAEVASGAQNYECRLEDDGSGPPTLTYLRLCEAGESPWGCPQGSG
jgi:hypothetical protein